MVLLRSLQCITDQWEERWLYESWGCYLNVNPLILKLRGELLWSSPVCRSILKAEFSILGWLVGIRSEQCLKQQMLRAFNTSKRTNSLRHNLSLRHNIIASFTQNLAKSDIMGIIMTHMTDCFTSNVDQKRNCKWVYLVAIWAWGSFSFWQTVILVFLQPTCAGYWGQTTERMLLVQPIFIANQWGRARVEVFFFLGQCHLSQYINACKN